MAAIEECEAMNGLTRRLHLTAARPFRSAASWHLYIFLHSTFPPGGGR
jgi:hypothetical protein